MTLSDGGESPEKSIPLWKNPFVIAFVVGALSLIAIRPLQYAARSAPPPLLEPGAWSLVDHDGKPYGTHDLSGKVWIADFFFTRCPSICPELTRKLDEVRKQFPDDPNIAFVSFSVDPDYDTPEVLRNHRSKLGIQDPHWRFVTGSKENVHEWLSERLRLHVGLPEREDPQDDLFDISHTSRFALFDQNGALRALSSTDEPGLARLVGAASLLLEEGPNP
jgi:protein SCO1/2